MSNLILLSIVLITLALILYSTAVWLNWRSRRLTPAYILIFWCAVASDTVATRLMGASIATIRWDLHTTAATSHWP